MKKTTITTTEDAWQCEVCGTRHINEWGGKWAIFHCPKHGEFCNDGLGNCGLFRYVEKFGRDRICCPICGWSPNEDWAEKYDDRNNEIYDKRTGTFPKTEKELQSFHKAQDWIFKYPKVYSGMMSYRRLLEY